MDVPGSVVNMLESYPAVAVLGAIPVVLVFVYLMADEKKWIKFEFILGGCIFFSLPAANYTLSVWLGGKTGDTLAKLFFIFVLLGMITQAFAFYLTRNTKDPIVPTSLAISNILSRCGLLFGAVYALKYVKGFSPVALKGDCIFLSFLLIGDLLHLKKLSIKDGVLKVAGDGVRVFAAIDAVASFIIGLAFLGFSHSLGEIIVRGTDVTEVHSMLMKSFGSQLLATSLRSFASLCYKSTPEVSRVLQSKFVIYVPMLAISFWSLLTAAPGQTDWSLIFIIFVSFFLCMVAVFGQYESPYITDKSD